MTKVYRINGKEIERGKEILLYGNDYQSPKYDKAMQKVNELLEALDEKKERNVVFLDIRTEKEREIEYPHHKNSCNVFNLNGKCDCKEEPKEECFYCDMRLPSKPDKGRKIFNWHLNGHKEEPKPEEMGWRVYKVRNGCWRFERNDGSYTEHSTQEGARKMAESQQEPKSTLRDKISYEITYAHGGSAVVDKTVDEIISLFKDTLLEEVEKQMPEQTTNFPNGEREIYQNVINLIKNL